MTRDGHFMRIGYRDSTFPTGLTQRSLVRLPLPASDRRVNWPECERTRERHVPLRPRTLYPKGIRRNHRRGHHRGGRRRQEAHFSIIVREQTIHYFCLWRS